MEDPILTLVERCRKAQRAYRDAVMRFDDVSRARIVAEANVRKAEVEMHLAERALVEGTN